MCEELPGEIGEDPVTATARCIPIETGELEFCGAVAYDACMRVISPVVYDEQLMEAHDKRIALWGMEFPELVRARHGRRRSGVQDAATPAWFFSLKFVRLPRRAARSQCVVTLAQSCERCRITYFSKNAKRVEHVVNDSSQTALLFSSKEARHVLRLTGRARIRLGDCRGSGALRAGDDGVHAGIQGVLLSPVISEVRGGRGKTRDVFRAAIVLRLLHAESHGVHRGPDPCGHRVRQGRDAGQGIHILTCYPPFY